MDDLHGVLRTLRIDAKSAEAVAREKAALPQDAVQVFREFVGYLDQAGRLTARTPRAPKAVPKVSRPGARPRGR